MKTKKSKKICIKHKKEKIIIDVKPCNIFNRFTGLMFTKREKAEILLFDFKKPVEFSIHSLFVFFQFIAVWLNYNNKVIEKRIINPFTLSIKPNRAYNKLVEIPINNRHKQIIKLLVGD